MIKFRQIQAKKSILIKLAENHIHDFEKFCTKYVNIEKIFFYNTMHNKVSIFCDFYFILVDLKITILNTYLNNYVYYILSSVLY